MAPYFFMYASWIPCAAGFLSFSHIGGNKIKNRIFHEEINPPDGFMRDPEVVVVRQKRNLSDKISIGPINSNPIRGRHEYFLVAKLNEESVSRSINGYILTMPEDVFKRCVPSFYRELAVSQSFDDVESVMLSAPDRINPIGPGGYVLSKFTVHGDGLFELEIISGFDGVEPAVDKLKAFEIYSFVRDLLHSHRFHSSTDDAILDPIVQPSIEEGKEVVFDHVARALHRSVISCYRGRLMANQIMALGQLSYLESFVKVMERRGICSGKYVSSLETLRSAITASCSRCQYDADHHGNKRNAIMAITTLILPLLFVVVQFLQIPCIDGLSYNKDNCGLNKFYPSVSVVGAASYLIGHLEEVAKSMLALWGIAFAWFNYDKIIYKISNYMGSGTFKSDFEGLLLRVAISYRVPAIIFCLSASVLMLILIYQITFNGLIDYFSKIAKSIIVSGWLML